MPSKENGLFNYGKCFQTLDKSRACLLGGVDITASFSSKNDCSLIAEVKLKRYVAWVGRLGEYWKWKKKRWEYSKPIVVDALAMG